MPTHPLPPAPGDPPSSPWSLCPSACDCLCCCQCVNRSLLLPVSVSLNTAQKKHLFVRLCCFPAELRGPRTPPLSPPHPAPTPPSERAFIWISSSRKWGQVWRGPSVDLLSGSGGRRPDGYQSSSNSGPQSGWGPRGSDGNSSCCLCHCLSLCQLFLPPPRLLFLTFFLFLQQQRTRLV